MVDFFLRQNHACFMGFSWDFAGSNGYVYWNLMELHWNVLELTWISWDLLYLDMFSYASSCYYHGDTTRSIGHLIFGDDWESPLHLPPVITM